MMSGTCALLAASAFTALGVVLSGRCQANAFTVGPLTVNPSRTALPPVSGTLFLVDIGLSGPVVSNEIHPLAGIVPGSLGGKYAAPVTDAMATKYAGNYLVTGIGLITIQFRSLETIFGLLWGAVDGYNTISFATLDGPVSFIGALMPANAGCQGFGSLFYTTITSSVPFSSVTLSSTEYSFEAAAMVYGTALPEPGNMVTGSTQGGAVVYGMAPPEPGGLALRFWASAFLLLIWLWAAGWPANRR